MNPEFDGRNGQANLLAHGSGANGTLNASLTLEPEACSNGTLPNIPPQRSPSLKNLLQHQSSHQGDSPKSTGT